MIGKFSLVLCSVAIACAFSAVAGADSVVYQGVSPWTTTDVAAGWPTAFDALPSGQIVALSGLSVNLLSADGAFVRSIGSAPNYSTGSEYGSFCRVSPDGSQVWVGFTTTNNADDRIYSLPFAGGSATHEATLAGNYDLEFAKVGGVYKPFASGSDWTANNAVWKLDTVGGAHVKVAQLGGYGTGFAVDAAGNLYAMNQTAHRLYRFAAADVEQAALGSAGFLTSDNATFTADTTFGGSDITIDGAGNVFFNANDTGLGGASFVAMLQPLYAGPLKYDVIANGIVPVDYANFLYGNWATQIDFGSGSGDARLGQGLIFLNDYSGGGNLTELAVPEPASLVLALSACAGFGLWRRRAAGR